MDHAAARISINTENPRQKTPHALPAFTPANDCQPVSCGDKLNGAYTVQQTLYQEPASATTVQLVVDHHTGKQLTLKRVAKPRLFTPEQEESARRELAIYSKLAHPNIVRLFSAAETSTEYLFLMEYLPHADYFVEKLEVNNCPLMLRPEGGLLKLRAFCHDVLTALSYLHELGIIHMDIKPANLLRAEGTVKLCDFGLSRQVDATGRAYLPLRCGTDGYMAPEVRSGGWVTPAADMWSFGIFVHVLVFGYSPFALKWQKDQALPQFARHWRKYASTSLYDFLSSFLLTDPTKRMSASSALQHPFFTEVIV